MVCVVCVYLLLTVEMSGRGGGTGTEGDTDPPVTGPVNLQYVCMCECHVCVCVCHV